MTTPPSLCQCIDIFKRLRISGTDSDSLQVEGNVSYAMDRAIGKQVFVASGRVSGANYFQIPSNKESLPPSFQKKFLYMLIKVTSKENYSIHVEILTANGLVIRLSFSNSFTKFKKTNRSFQIPSTALKDKWCIFVVDVHDILDIWTTSEFGSLRSLSFCGNIRVRNVFLSDLIYTPKILPREMAFPVRRGTSWFQSYDWFEFPDSEDRLSPVPRQVTDSESNVVVRLPYASPRNIPTPSPPSEFGCDSSEAARDVRRILEIQCAKLRPDVSDTPSQVTSVQSSLISRQQTVDEMRRQNDLRLRAMNLELSQVVGVSGGLSRVVHWYKDELFWINHKAVIAMNVETRETRTFNGADKDLCVMELSHDHRILAAGQDGRPGTIHLWNTATTQHLTTLCAHEKHLCSLSFSPNNTHLVVVGKDTAGRVLIVVWNIAHVLTYPHEKPEIVARQTSEFSVKRMAFCPFHTPEGYNLVSVGRNSIRFWRMKNNHVRGYSVILNEHSQNNFTDFGFDPSLKRLLVAGDRGQMFEVSCTEHALSAVYYLHESRINCVIVNEGFCVTGCDDKFMRVWPMDFASLLLEMSLDSAVTSLGFSPDGLGVVCVTESNVIGCMDIAQHTFETKMRAHGLAVTCLCGHPRRNVFATGSDDRSVRIWELSASEASSPTTVNEIVEYKITDGIVRCLAFCPTSDPNTDLIACGFDDGRVKILDNNQCEMLVQFQQHSASVCDIKYDPNGRYMFSCGIDGIICVYNVAKTHQPMHLIPFCAEQPGRWMKLSVDVSFDGTQLAVTGTPVRIENQGMEMGDANAPKVMVFDLRSFEEIVSWDLATVADSERICLMMGDEFMPTSAVVGGTVVQFGRDGILYVVFGNGKVSRYDLRDDGQPPRILDKKLQLPNTSRYSVISSMIGENFCVIGGPNGAVNLASLSTPSPQEIENENPDAIKLKDLNVQTRAGHVGPVVGMTITRDGEFLISCAEDGIRVWQCAGMKPFVPEDLVTNSESEDIVLVAEKIDEKESESQESAVEAELVPEEIVEDARAQVEETAEDDVKSEDETTVDDVSLSMYKEYPNHSAMKIRLRSFESDELRLKKIIGFDGSNHDNVVWHPEHGFILYSIGNILVRDNLCDRSQQIGVVSQCITCIAVSHDGSMIASGTSSDSKTDSRCSVTVWNADGVEVQSNYQVENHVQTLTFSVNHRFLICVCGVNFDEMNFWNLEENEEMFVQLPHSAHQIVAFPGDDCRWLSVSSSAIFAWKWSDGEIDVLRIHQEDDQNIFILDAKFLTKTKLDVLLSNGSILSFSVGDSITLKQTRTVQLSHPNRHNLTKFKCSLTTDAIIMGTPTGIYKINSKTFPKEDCKSSTIDLDSAAVSWSFPTADANIGVVGTSRNTVWYVDFNNESGIRLVNSHRSEITAVSFDPTRDLLVTVARDGSMRMWDLRGGSAHGQQVMQYEVGTDETPLCVATSPLMKKSTPMPVPPSLTDTSGDIEHGLVKQSEKKTCAVDAGTLVAVGYDCGKLRLFDVFACRLLHTFEFDARIVSVDFLCDNGIVVCGCESGAMYVVDWKAQKFESVSSRNSKCVVSKLKGFTWMAHFADGHTHIYETEQDLTTRHVCDMTEDGRKITQARFCPGIGGMLCAVSSTDENEEKVVLEVLNEKYDQILDEIELPVGNGLSQMVSVTGSGQKRRVLVSCEDGQVWSTDFEGCTDVLEVNGPAKMASNCNGNLIALSAWECVFIFEII